ncbi:uncharacterized protein [Prorops nasuta]
MDEDYALVARHFSSPTKQEKSKQKEQNQNENNDKQMKQQSKGGKKKKAAAKTYIPGILKIPYRFPRPSVLCKEEQALCLRVHLKFSASGKPELTQVDKEELQTYLSLKDYISEEQDEYLKLAQANWDGTKIKCICEEFVNTKWSKKMQTMNYLPRYYLETTNIPIIAEKPINLEYVSTCKVIGHPSNINLPIFGTQYILTTSSIDLQDQFLNDPEAKNKHDLNFKLPVSQDFMCRNLVNKCDADMVISSSGLKCLINNAGPKYNNSWILPILIESHNGKNIIFVDKPVPPTIYTVLEKNNIACKYILRNSFVVQKLSKKSRLNCQEKLYDDILGDLTSEELLQYEEDGAYVQKEKYSFKEHIETKEKTCACTRMCQCEQESIVEDSTKEINLQNTTYSIFNLGPQTTKQNELMKDNIKQYKILIRTKHDGIMTLENGVTQPISLAPRLEHQVSLGAEAITLEEGLHQWISLITRPETILARVRISVETSEIIQIEKRSAMAISNEVNRLYSVNVYDTLGFLHNIIQNLTNAQPGRYLLKHTERNGMFASVMKEAKSPGKNTYDLDTVRKKTEVFTSPCMPWPALDKALPTPMHKLFERMPAMYYPSQKRHQNKRKPLTKATLKKGLRRSTRNKGKKK